MAEIEIRAATDPDVAGVIALIEDRIGAEDAPEARLVLEDAHFDRRRWTVAVDGGRVVSTMATFPMDLRFGVCRVPSAMIEFVATDRTYEGKGLIRRQFEYHHHDVAQRGELFQIIVGITYFYRRLGYEYALPVADWRSIAATEVPGVPPGWTVREAGEADRDVVMQIQAHTQDAAAVAIGFSDSVWSHVLRSPVYQTLLAERDGVAEACGRLYTDDDEAFLMDVAASDGTGLDAVVAAAQQRVGERPVHIMDRQGTAQLLDGRGVTESPGDSYYARIADPVAFLNAVRPELNRRLGASELAAAHGTGLISLYSSSIRFSYANGELSEFERHGVEQAPISKGGSGVAPDRFTSLVVGPHGFVGLEALNPDVIGGKQEALMNTLFPPQTADVQSWVVP